MPSCRKCQTEISQTSLGQLCEACLLSIGLDAAFAHPTDQSNETEKENSTPSAAEKAKLEPIHLSKRYQLLGEVARGGMGVIHRVFDRELNRELALKVMRPDRRRQSEQGNTYDLMSRFLSEAQISAQLDHPGIIPVHDVDFDTQGNLFFTMKLVKGKELSDIIEDLHREKAVWKVSRAVETIIRASEAVAYAHSKGILHRDLKPSNIMVGEYGEVYVMDWGLARSNGTPPLSPIKKEVSSLDHALLDGSSLQTLTGSIIGTPSYMPPEQESGNVNDLDERCDIYALGAILNHLLTGKRPLPSSFRDSDSVPTTFPEHSHSPYNTESHAPPALQAISAKAMALNKEDRFPSVKMFIKELQAWLDGKVVESYQTGAWAELKSWIGRNRSTAIFSALTALTLILGLSFATWFQTITKREFQRRNYVSQINQAGEATLAGKYDEAKFLLETTPAANRHWEWNFLNHSMNQWSILKEVKFTDGLANTVVNHDHTMMASNVPGKGVMVRQLRTGDQIYFLEDKDTHYDSTLRFSPTDSRLLFSINASYDHRWHILDAENQKISKSFRTHSSVLSLTFDSNGQYVYTCEQSGTIRRWDPDSGSNESLINIPGAYSLACSPNGATLAIGNLDGRISIWDIKKSRQTHHLKTNRSKVGFLEFSPDSKSLLSLSYSTLNGSHQLWDLEQETSVSFLNGIGVTSVKFDQATNYLIAGDSVGRLRVLNARNLVEETNIQTHFGDCMDVGILEDGSFYFVGRQGAVTLLELRDRPVSRIAGHSYPLRSAAMIHKGTKAVTSGLGQEVVVWDLPNQKKIHTFEKHRGFVYALAGSPKEDLVISGGDHLVLCWNPNTLQVRWEGLVELNQECWWAQFDQSGSRAITGTETGIVTVWDVNTGAKIARIEAEGPKKDSDGASISPDGKHVAVFMRSPHVIQLWDIETSQLVWKVPANTNRGVTFSPHGRWLATGNQDGSIDLLDVKNGGQLVRSFISHQNSVNDIAFTLDSERMFSCSSDGWVKVWDPKTGDQLLSLPVDNKIKAWNIEVSQIGGHMIVADQQGGINIWSSIP